MKRSLTIDFLRGFAIFMMVFLHVVQRLWVGIDNVAELDFLFSLPIYFLVPVVILAFLGSWAGLFLLISMSANVIAIERRIKLGHDLKSLRNRQILAGFIILVLAYFTETFTVYAGVFGYWWETGEYDPQRITRGLFNWETLNAIGLCIIITSSLLYLLYKNDGHKKVQRNVTILLGLAFLIVLLTPLIEYLIQQFIYPWWSVTDTETQYTWPPDSFGELLLRLILIPINGHLEPLFPFLATALVGTIFGIMLSQEKPPQSFPRLGMTAGLITIVFAIVLVVLGVNIEPSLGWRPDIPWYFLGLGGQIFVYSLFLYFIEFKGHIHGFKRITTPWRRWGMLALTIYSLPILDIPAKYLMYWITGWDTISGRALTKWPTIIMALVIILYWDIILRLWSRVNFKFSYEWIIVNNFTSRGGVRSDRLNIQKVIHEVEPMDFSGLYIDDPKPVRSSFRSNPWITGSVSYFIFFMFLVFILTTL